MRIAVSIWALLFFAVGFHPACAADDVRAARPPAFYVGSHGWHTSIVIPRADIPKGLWPRGVAERTFAGYTFLEIGWGDRKFYPAPKPNALMALDAVLSPGPSVLHVVGLKPPLEDALSWSALVPVPCSREQFVKLCAALAATFERNARGEPDTIGPGL